MGVGAGLSFGLAWLGWLVGWLWVLDGGVLLAFVLGLCFRGFEGFSWVLFIFSGVFSMLSMVFLVFFPLVSLMNKHFFYGFLGFSSVRFF